MQPPFGSAHAVRQILTSARTRSFDLSPASPALRALMSRATILSRLFESLAGRWTLERNLHSTNASEPSGKCYGVASFTARPPSPVLSDDGKLYLAKAELLYHEQGEFELPNSMRLPFSKKYIWRWSQESHDINVWFAKPADDSVD